MVRVSVVLPTHAQGEHIADAMEALNAQTFTDFELIVVCDGPPDKGTEAALEMWRPDDIIVLPENKGTAEALNAGFARARGELFTWVSSDNEMDIQWLEVLVAELDARPDVGCVYSAYLREEGKIENGRWRPLGMRFKHFVDIAAAPLIEDENCPIGPSFLYRREFHQEHRGRISHDYDNWLRFEEVAPIVGIPRPLCVYRVHDERVTVTRRAEYDAGHWRDAAMMRRAAK